VACDFVLDSNILAYRYCRSCDTKEVKQWFRKPIRLTACEGRLLGLSRGVGNIYTGVATDETTVNESSAPGYPIINRYVKIYIFVPINCEPASGCLL
jgi:hypothetical protein